MMKYNMFEYHTLPVVPARGGAEVALGKHYKTFHIYRTCMRRVPAKPGVRAACANALHLGAIASLSRPGT